MGCESRSTLLTHLEGLEHTEYCLSADYTLSFERVRKVNGIY